MRVRGDLDLKVFKFNIFLGLNRKISPSFLLGVELPYRPHKESDATIRGWIMVSIPDREVSFNFCYGKYYFKVGVLRLRPVLWWCSYYATGVGG